jgi:hypothetical protein
MTQVQQLALTVEEDGLVDFGELAKVAAALQKQATRDLAPIWNIQAAVSAFATLEDVPLGYWPMIVAKNVEDAAGYHEDKEGQPFALIELGTSWSLTASHECLEMLVDPFGKRLIAGDSPKKGQGRVEFLVEVCDPSEDEKFAYTVNGIMVSDFYTPRYFDPKPASGVRYSFTGALTRPRQVLAGGYLSWTDPKDGSWWQETYFGSKPAIRKLGKFDAKFRTYRAFIDAHTPELHRLSHLDKKSASMKSVMAAGAGAAASTNAKAQLWRSEIKELRKTAQKNK